MSEPNVNPRRGIRKHWFVIPGLLAVAFYALTLGILFSHYVRAYCQGGDSNLQPEVYVHMDPVYQETGIPHVCGIYSDALPYPMDIFIKVDDRVEGEGVVIESFDVVFEDGETGKVVVSSAPRGGPFAEYEPVSSDRVEGRTYRAARIGIPTAIWRRGGFSMKLRGYIYGRKKQPFTRELRMDYNREFKIYTGWQILAGAAC